jgi:hypothetical protein
MGVGVLKKLTRPCLGNPVGAIGVCYDVYEETELCTPGASYIFPNGEYDGFSMEDEKMFFDDAWEGFCTAVQTYQFSNVRKLSIDFNAGVFRKAWL